MHTRCKQCNCPIVGRTDKQYCSASCRRESFKQRQEIRMKAVNATNAILLKNREIMRSLCTSGTIVVERRTLAALGMNFSVFTSLYITGSGRSYYFSYDFAFSPTIEANVYKAIIVSRFPELQAFDPWSHPGTT